MASKVDKGNISVDDAREFVGAGLQSLREFAAGKEGDPNYQRDRRMSALKVHDEMAKVNPDLASAGLAVFLASEAERVFDNCFGRGEELMTETSVSQLQMWAFDRSARLLLDEATSKKG